MFGLFKKKRVPLVGLMDGFYDAHSHLLWGVDDGCQEAEDSVAVVGMLADMGVRGAYLTPHIIYGVHGSRSEVDMRQQFEKMPPLGDFEVRLAAEYHLDENFITHVEGPEPLLTLGGEWLLVEYGLGTTRATHQSELFEVALSGTNIIIAHPERYSFLSERGDMHELAKLTDKNYALQLNILAITGYYGERVRKVAEKLLVEGRYTFVGSDCHSKVHAKSLAHGEIDPKMVEPLQQLMENNRRILWK